VIVDPDFLDHWRTRMLVDALGGDESAPLYVIRVWAHCQQRRGDSFAMPAAGLRALCRAPCGADAFEAAMVDAGFIERNGQFINVPKWSEKNASLIAAWENGNKGGRPKKEPKENPRVTDQEPTANPSRTQAEPIRLREEQRQEEQKTKTARKRAAPAVLVSLPELVAEGVDEQHATDWLIARKSKGLPLTPTAWADVKSEAIKARVSPGEAIKAAAGNGWAGFKAAWMDEKPRNGQHQSAYELKAADAAKWIKGTSLDRSMIFDPEACDAVTPALR
jgi:hypothetical protein